MKPRRILIALAVVIVGLAGFSYGERLFILRYWLGWQTDIIHPREAYRPVPWMAGPASADKPPAERPPNIVVILADDLGINDVTTHGGGYGALGVPTPNINSIARDGVRFDQGYAGSAVCTVSRAALLTGRYPWRFGVEFTPTPGEMATVASDLYADPDRLYPVIVDREKAGEAKTFNDLGMPASEKTVAELLKARGYHSIHIGKWHLGSTPEMRPNNQGFDESLFMESGLYLPENDANVVNSKQDFDPIDRFLWPNMRFAVSYNAGRWFEPAKYLTDYFTDEAVTAIKRNKNQPFFLYLAHWGVHTPLQASKADYDALPNIADHRQRVYAAMVRSVDRSVGRVLQALRDEGLDQNTIVIFTSDNGAPGYIGLPEVNKPYRGWKLTFFQGGVRVPYVAKWPGHIAAGTRYAPPVSNIDILPTVVAAAGAGLPTDRLIDGVNLLPFLSASPAIQGPRPMFWRDGPYRAVIDKDWKLIVSGRPVRSWLFDLDRDPTEKVDLAAKRPDKVAELGALLQAHNAAMPPPLWPSFIEFPILIDKTLNQKESVTDEYTYWLELKAARLISLAAAAIMLAGGTALCLGEPQASGPRLSCALPRQDRMAPHPGMVWVPGGSFDFGDSIYAEELPIRRTSLPGFWMDRTELTNDQFAQFVRATGYVTAAERPVDPRLSASLPPEMRQPGAVVFVAPKAADRRGDVTQWWRFVPGANWRHPGGPQTTIAGHGSFPVVTVTFEDATAYAHWKGHELPSEAQWEWAARAGQAHAELDHEQPQQANTWQGIFPVLNSADDGFTGLAPVGCYAANALGLFDMIGNVWELTSDAFTPSHAGPAGPAPDQIPADMRGVVSTGQRVIKGGSFLCSPDYCMRYRSGARQPQDDDLGASHLGFRTILAAPGP